ncbi:carph-isopro domain-containing protein [Sphingomonas faeni]|uniref:carph-isopro domain-containing protein n=1 Tax=Sphingomonas faeni TaxID=185950 RepID=UPI0033651AC3
MTTKELINSMGGIRATARCLGHRSHTTVQGWCVREVIPTRQQRQILELARKQGIVIEPIDLIAGVRS